MKIVGITQARYGSTRLKGKVLKEIQGDTLLQIHLERLLKSSIADQWIVATTDEPEAELIAGIAKNNNVYCYKGSTNDVLDRYYQAAKIFNPDFIVRVTSDCPLIDPKVIDDVIDFTVKNNMDYGANIMDRTYPDGQDIEVIKYTALKEAWSKAKGKEEREHVTPFIRNNSSFYGGRLFTSDNYRNNTDYSKVRMTVDYGEDFKLIKQLVSKLGKDKGWLEYTNYILSNKELSSLSEQFIEEL